AAPMRPGKRMPILTVEANGDARIDLWCRTVPARVEIADMAIKIDAAPLPEELPAMQGAGQCTPERMQADGDLLIALVQMTGWRREGDAIVLVGATPLRFRPATN
ncbi:MAG: META domain-containing protein, partial [Euryarchaeota archaeon]|nr:META domain-containing protein [Euryarchaeota archaeon]